MSNRGVSDRLTRALPDAPRWIETRAMLLSGECEMFGLEEREPSFVVRDPELISVVGHPSQSAIRTAASADPVDLLAFPENREHVSASLPDWTAVRAVLYLLGDARRFPEVPRDSVRWLAESEIDTMEGLPSDLRSELEQATTESPIATALEDDRPVAFCYAGSRTEGLWDVAIDTLTEYQRRGYAARCFTYMAEHMKPLRPVWAAEETNAASLGLAAKLGFVPVDELIVFHPPRH